MQYIPNGPQIPDELLQAHQDGRVVFFCGSGISIPCGLPNFCGLVKQIYEKLNQVPTDLESKLKDTKQFDQLIESLEKRKSRESVRKCLMKILTPGRKKLNTKTHLSLLRLSESEEGVYKIVTTNFDRIFEDVARKNRIKINSYAAPLVPIPKDEYWNGIVYLHGLLPKHTDEASFRKLILSSSDFGLAYLTERWASRFITELFRNYIVCFVGYSANDAILRYMLDALAADNQLNKNANPVYAFAGFNDGNREQVSEDWESKGIIPILYDDKKNHALLHSTINAWADLYVNGVDGKKQIVEQFARSSPCDSTQEDDIVGRVLWAISDKSGDVAKYFSTLEPIPSLDWLTAFYKKTYSYKNLQQFNAYYGGIKENLEFSILNRPSNPFKTTWMYLVSNRSPYCDLDSVMINLAKWLLNYLNNEELVLWIVEHGGILHPYFADLIENRIRELREFDDYKKKELLKKTPDAIPSEYMEKLWFLILGNCLKNNSSYYDLFHWKILYNEQGLNFSTRKKLYESLSPKIIIEKYINFFEDDKNENKLTINVTLSCDYVKDATKDLKNIPEFSSLLGFFQSLLTKTLELSEEIEIANSKNDRSHWYLPSIEQHWQNDRRYEDWVVLIELLRDSWLKLLSTDEQKATCIAKEWFNFRYPTFKRLALFAVTKIKLFPSKIWIDWILADNAFCLWSVSTSREIMRLLFHKGKVLSKIDKVRLENAILLGPSRKLYKPNITAEKFAYEKNYSIWHLLAKLQSSGAKLGAKAKKQLNILEKHHPNWSLPEDEKDEFPSWISGSGDPGWEDAIIEKVPYKFKDLIEFLKQERDYDRFEYRSNWNDFCKKYPRRVAFALLTLIRENTLDPRWLDSALYEWSADASLAFRIWNYYLKARQYISVSVIEKSRHPISWWIEKVSRSMDDYREDLLSLCQKIFVLNYAVKMRFNGKPMEMLTDASNHPIGLATQALFNVWFNAKPKDNDKLPSKLKDILVQFCDKNVEKFSYARVFLGEHLIPLYRVDKEWAEKNVIPLLDWKKDKICTRTMWAGFFARNQIDLSLMVKIKKEFLFLIDQYNELEGLEENFIEIFTDMTLKKSQVFTPSECRSAFHKLPIEAFEKVSKIMERTIRNSTNRSETFNNIIKPFFKKYFQVENTKNITQEISLNLAFITILADCKFQDAFDLLNENLISLKYPFSLLNELKDSELCKKYPEQVLTLLSKIIDEHTKGIMNLKEILEDIAEVAPLLKRRTIFRKLNEIAANRSAFY